MKTYTDIAYVEGIYDKNAHMQEAFYHHCRRYFDDNYNAMFFAQKADADDIFENTFITLWQNIERRKIYVEDGVLRGKGGLPFVGTLTTYLMSIAALKYREHVRSNIRFVHIEDMACAHENGEIPVLKPGEIIIDDWLDESNPMQEVTAECVANLSERCHEILTLFYGDGLCLDEIMDVLPSFTSKDALKTAKNKCLDKLRTATLSLYEIRKNK